MAGVAANAYEAALKYDTSRPMRRTILFVSRPRATNRPGQQDKAIKAYEDALAHDKKNWRRHRDFALQYEQVGRYDDALGPLQAGAAFPSREKPFS